MALRPSRGKRGLMLSLWDRYIPMARTAVERRKANASRWTRAATTVAEGEARAFPAFRFLLFAGMSGKETQTLAGSKSALS
jgi:hypothetical protein